MVLFRLSCLFRCIIIFFFVVSLEIGIPTLVTVEIYVRYATVTKVDTKPPAIL